MCIFFNYSEYTFIFSSAVKPSSSHEEASNVEPREVTQEDAGVQGVVVDTRETGDTTQGSFSKRRSIIIIVCFIEFEPTCIYILLCIFLSIYQ